MMNVFNKKVFSIILLSVLMWGSLFSQVDLEEEGRRWGRINSHVASQMSRLGLFPTDKEKPFSQLLEGVFYFGNLDKEILLTLPLWKPKQNIPRGEKQNQVVRAGNKTVNKEPIRIRIRADIDTSTLQTLTADIEKRFRYEERTKKIEFSRIKGNLNTGDTLSIPHEVVIKNKSYGSFPGKMIILKSTGPSLKLSGLLQRGQFEFSVYEPVPDGGVEDIFAAFELTTKDQRRIIVSIGTSGTSEGRYEIPFPSEEVLDKVMHLTARALIHEYNLAPDLEKMSDCGKKEELTRYLSSLRDHHKKITILNDDIDTMQGASEPGENLIKNFGDRIDSAGQKFLHTLQEFKNAETRRGLHEELELISETAVTLNEVIAKYRLITGSPDIQIDHETRRSTTDKIGRTVLKAARYGVASRLESEGLQVILTSDSWNQAVDTATLSARKKVDEFLNFESQRIFELGFYDIHSAERALQLEMRREVHRQVAKLLVKITSNSLIIELAAAPIIRWIERDLLPHLKEIFRNKGNLTFRFERSVSTLNNARIDLNRLPCTAKLAEVKRAMQSARETFNATKFLEKDLRHAGNTEMLDKLLDAKTDLERTLILTTNRFLLDKNDYEEDLDFVVTKIEQMLQSLKTAVPPDAQQFRLEEEELGSIPSLGAEVAGIQFYELGPEGVLEGEERNYQKSFPSSSSRSIYWELYIKYPPPDRKTDFDIEAVWYRPDKTIMTRQTKHASIEADWNGSYHRFGWGWKEPGHWKPGTYKVGFFVHGNKIADSSFEITDG